jgi:dCMP deaminase
MKPKHIKAHMQTAENYAKLSTARRLQVGAILVKEDRIISIGYNGMPAGWDNNCEDKDYMSSDAGGWLSPEEIYEQWPFEETVMVANDNESFELVRRYRLKTKPEVLHAEANAIAKVARSAESAEGAVLFVTHAPCIDCAKLVYQSGIKQVFYRDNYRSTSGIDFLNQAGVIVNKLDSYRE